MTFEEFFVKKRIDLSKFEQDNPSLLAEMRGHYEQMGSKSFDHSKKFWFNKLRHLYLLDQPIPSVKTETAIPAAGTINQDAQKATPEAAPTGFKPRFKPRAAAAPAPEPQKDSEPAPSDSVAELEKTEPASTAQAAPAPTGFKPRFRAPKSQLPALDKQTDKDKQDGQQS